MGNFKGASGKWYKNKSIPSTFINCKVFTEDEKGGYGVHMNIWSENWGLLNFQDYVEATTEEVTEALKKEAVKRGFKSNVFVKGLGNTQDGTFSFDMNTNCLYCGSYAVFNDGIWAEIIPTKTIQEAEKLLKELGHEFKIV